MVQFFNQWTLLLPAEDRLAIEMERNFLYPFNTTDGLYTLELTVKYKSLYFAIAMLIGSVACLIVMAVSGSYSQIWFLASICSTFVSLALINNFKDTRHYILNTALMEYTFAHSHPFSKDRMTYVTGSYHNIYIRLRKEVRDGSRRFYLILNGYRMDSRQISGSSRNLEEMRRLGQKIAENLNLNFFDVTNSSEYHVIRHHRPVKKHRDFLKTIAGSQKSLGAD